MGTLHTVNKSPFERGSLDTCLGYALEDSTVLLIEDGVYAALAKSAVSEQVNDAMARVRFCALRPDLEMRGIAPEQLIDGVALVDYEGFVDLVVEHDRVQNWL